MRKTPDRTVYRGTFSRLKLNSFGIAQTVEYQATIEVYQVRVSPELWKARPHFAHGPHSWQASSAATLMNLIAGDFEECISIWSTRQEEAAVKRRPSLTDHLKNDSRKAG